MQVLTNTRERLVLEIRFTVFAALSWVSAMTLLYSLYDKWSLLGDVGKWGIGLTALAFTAGTVYFLRPSVFEFDRTANEFRWVRPGLFRSHSGHTSLDQIKRVRVDANDSDGTKGYRVLVETQAATIPFQHGYTTSEASSHHQIVDLIRTWLAR